MHRESERGEREMTNEQLLIKEESDRIPASPSLLNEHLEQRDPPSTEQNKDPHPNCYCTDMRERITVLEGGLV